MNQTFKERPETPAIAVFHTHQIIFHWKVID
jgi:hypothetical protein